MNELNSGTGLTIELPGRAAATLGHYLPDSFDRATWRSPPC